MVLYVLGCGLVIRADYAAVRQLRNSWITAVLAVGEGLILLDRRGIIR